MRHPAADTFDLHGRNAPGAQPVVCAAAGRIGRPVASLYAVNSLGAGAGALACGFVLLPEAGLTWTLRIACGTAIAVCLLMLLLDRRLDTPSLEDAPNAQAAAAREKPDLPSTAWRSSLLVMYGLSGAAALVYEVGWTRALALVIGSTTYAFSLMLAAFIIGLAVGSAIVGRLIDRLSNRVFWFALVELGIGLSAMAALPFFGHMPIWIANIVQHHRDSWAVLQLLEFGLILLVMVVPTTLMGAAFPLVVRACAKGPDRIARSVGGVYAANTIGGIAGAFAASFLLIPHIGTQNTILAAVAANVLIAAALLWLLPATTWRRRAIGGLAVAAYAMTALLWLPAWDPSVMTCGAYLYAINLAPQGNPTALRNWMRSGKLLFHKEDICTDVTVRDYPDGSRVLAVDGKADASTGDDVPTQLMLGHVPPLLAPHPRTACVIGLASGMTLGAVAQHDVQRIDCVEISPAVVEASHLFDNFNGRPLSDPRVHLTIADGRNYLAMTSRRYDVIISEPSNPWIAGVADLFTRQFFDLLRHRLTPQGVACVWLQAYQIEPSVFRSVLATFQDVFPNTILFEARPFGDYMLIGSAAPLDLPVATLTRRLAAPRVQTDLHRLNIATPVDLLRCIIMTGNVAEYVRGAGRATDDNALLEYAAPRALYRPDPALRLGEDLNRYRAADLSFLAQGPAERSAIDALRQKLAPAVQAEKLATQAILLHRRGQLKEAYTLAAKAAQLDPAGPALLNSTVDSILEDAAALQRKGDIRRALLFCAEAANLAPNYYYAHEVFGELLAHDHRYPEAIEAFRRAAALQPQNPVPANNAGWLLATCPDDKIRNGPEAVRWAEQACQIDRYTDPSHVSVLAAAYAEAGRFDAAIATATGGLDLATRAGKTSLARFLEKEITLFRQGMPYRLPQAN